MEEGRIGFPRSLQVVPDLVQRIGMEAELEGHNGCVNCLEWNETGSLLASGSDDVQVIVWDPFSHRAVGSIMTGHTGNIFTVKFLPNSSDSLLVSGAADCKIRVHELRSQETTHVFSCHAGRVKRIATAANVPFMFWSAAEDGTVMQFDLRDPDSASSTNPRNVLVNLKAHMGSYAEAKCLAINPLWPEQLAVGANDPYVRLYDRRMLSCKSIRFATEPTVRLPWERPTLDSETLSGEDSSLPPGCVQYYVAGHLPQKQQEYKNKYRTLASTYLTFSPDGREILVNLGGEQIYLFDVNRKRKPQKFNIPTMPHTNGFVKAAQRVHSKPHCGHINGTTTNGVTNGMNRHLEQAVSVIPASGTEDKIAHTKSRRRQCGRTLPPAVEALKQRANSVFEKQQYTQAILLYNEALAMASNSPILYSNRAAAYMKRNWDGDLYAALRDCHCAIQLDSDHLKAHFRLAKCLYELSWTQEALDCLQVFKSKFPDYAASNACESLDRDIRASIFSSIEPDGDAEKSSSGNKKRKDSVSEDERHWRSQAYDYELRFCGHCNTTTDIKEANFFGSNGQYIVAGSDDGSFFLWEKNTTNIVRVLRGDDSIVNCLQPHPTHCMMATSGIDPVVRLWSPRPEDGKKDEREVDNSDDAASANQRRMNADPLEVMLMNMGYRVTGVLDGDEDDEREGGEATVPCRPS